MLELRDAERKIVRLFSPHDTEPLEGLVRRPGRHRPEPLGLRTPARQGVTHGSAHLVSLDADATREVVREHL